MNNPYWECILNMDKIISQIDNDGLIINHTKDIDINDIKEFYFIYNKRKFGVDLNNNLLKLDNKSVEINAINKTPENSKIIVKRENVIEDSALEPTTSRINLTIYNINLKLNFYPNFYVDFFYS